jgi:integrase
MKSEFKISYFFWKARKDKSGYVPVFIKSGQNSNKQFTYNTGVRLLSDQWSKPKNQPKNKPAVLLELESKLQSTYRDLAGQGYEPTLDDLIKKMNDPKRPKGKKISDWINDYLSNEKYSQGQKKAVRTLKENIEAFNPNLTFDKVTHPILEDFTDWLCKRGVANNSQYKRIRALINVARHARLDIPDLTNFELPYTTANADKVRLDWGEVKSILDTETQSEIEAIAKDVFLLACFSGLRISDLLTLNKGKIKNFFYERTMTKTKKPVLITLHKYNEPLFIKYIKSGVPYTRQRLSAALKDVMERAGLTEEVTVIRAIGNKFSEETKEKYKEISFHSGRRFYARLLNDLGVGHEIARDELGHSAKSVTEHYAGSPNHRFRISRVRNAMEGLEKVMEELSLMRVA